MIENIAQVKPKRDKVIVKLIDDEVITPAGIVHPDKVKNYWEIIAVGPEVKDFAVGSVAMLSRQALTVNHLMTSFVVGGTTYALAKEEHFLAEVEKPPTVVSMGN